MLRILNKVMAQPPECRIGALGDFLSAPLEELMPIHSPQARAEMPPVYRQHDNPKGGNLGLRKKSRIEMEQPSRLLMISESAGNRCAIVFPERMAGG